MTSKSRPFSNRVTPIL